MRSQIVDIVCNRHKYGVYVFHFGWLNKSEQCNQSVKKKVIILDKGWKKLASAKFDSLWTNYPK
jgi:hypothetical protein